MIFWDILNSFGRLLLTCVSVVLITKYRHMTIAVERVGLAMAGSGSFLTVGIIWERNGSPFEGWSITLLTYGMVLFLSGAAYRKWRHDRANAEMAAMAGRWKEDRSRG